MSKKTPLIDLKNAASDGIGIEKPTRKNLDYLRVGYTDNDCPGALLFTTPAMKLKKVNKKGTVITAKFVISRKTFTNDIRRVIDPAIKNYLSENSDTLFGKKSSSRYIPLISTNDDGENIFRLDVTNSSLYNENGVIDEDIDIANCTGQFFRAAVHLEGIQKHEKRYRCDCCALQLKMVPEKYVDPKTDVECGYETECAK